MKRPRTIVVGALLGLIIVITFLNTGKTPTPDSPDGPRRGDNTAVRDSARDDGSAMSFFSRMFSSDEPGRAPGPGDEEPSGDNEPPRNEIFTLVDQVSKNESLPRNLLFPSGTSKEHIEEHSRNLREMVLYAELIRKGSASPQHKIRYYEIKIKMLEEKRGLIRHYLGLQETDGDREQSEKNLKLLDEKIAVYQEELRAL